MINIWRSTINSQTSYILTVGHTDYILKYVLHMESRKIFVLGQSFLSFPLLFICEGEEVPAVANKGPSGPCPPGKSRIWYEIRWSEDSYYQIWNHWKNPPESQDYWDFLIFF